MSVNGDFAGGSCKWTARPRRAALFCENGRRVPSCLRKHARGSGKGRGMCGDGPRPGGGRGRWRARALTVLSAGVGAQWAGPARGRGHHAEPPRAPCDRDLCGRRLGRPAAHPLAGTAARPLSQGPRPLPLPATQRASRRVQNTHILFLFNQYMHLRKSKPDADSGEPSVAVEATGPGGSEGRGGGRTRGRGLDERPVPHWPRL